jgi:hypothetical protein
MSTQQIITTPDVKLFVAAVRERLGDLTEEEREELVGGLDADMSDLVADRGVDALPDPAAYARELRTAAGFSAEGTAPRGARATRLSAWMDRGSDSWRRWVATGDHWGIPAFAQAMRPVWWVLRALCATALVAELVGHSDTFGFTPARVLLAVVAVVLSVQLGRGAWGTGRWHRPLFGRLVLVALNVLAILLLPVLAQRLIAPPAWAYQQSYADPLLNDDVAVFSGGHQVTNIYPYDAQGKPLVGVQLVDQDGRGLNLGPNPVDETTGMPQLLVPWMNGRTNLFSVFPLPERPSDPDTGEALGPGRITSPPFASLPPVTLSGVRPSVLVPPQTAAQLAARAAAHEKAVQQAAKKAKRHAGR